MIYKSLCVLILIIGYINPNIYTAQLDLSSIRDIEINEPTSIQYKTNMSAHSNTENTKGKSKKLNPVQQHRIHMTIIYSLPFILISTMIFHNVMIFYQYRTNVSKFKKIANEIDHNLVNPFIKERNKNNALKQLIENLPDKMDNEIPE
jgi:hypothetical protein